GLLLPEDLPHQLGVDVGPLLERAAHGLGLPLRLAAAADDELVRARLALAGLPALGQRALRADRVTATRAPTLATAHGVIVRVAHRAARDRAVAHPAVTAGLAQHDHVLLDVADLADRRPAV